MKAEDSLSKISSEKRRRGESRNSIFYSPPNKGTFFQVYAQIDFLVNIRRDALWRTVGSHLHRFEYQKTTTNSEANRCRQFQFPMTTSRTSHDFKLGNQMTTSPSLSALFRLFIWILGLFQWKMGPFKISTPYDSNDSSVKLDYQNLESAQMGFPIPTIRVPLFLEGTKWPPTLTQPWSRCRNWPSPARNSRSSSDTWMKKLSLSDVLNMINFLFTLTSILPVKRGCEWNARFIHQICLRMDKVRPLSQGKFGLVTLLFLACLSAVFWFLKMLFQEQMQQDLVTKKISFKLLDHILHW